MSTQVEFTAQMLEQYKQLEQWNDTHKAHAFDDCLHELIEAQVSRNPDADAVLFGGGRLNYNELNARANQCGRYLRRMGTGPDRVVAILMERSTEMVVALLSVLKSGGAYLPLDPGYPKERLDLILENAGVSIVLTQQKHEQLVADFSGTVFSLDKDWYYLSGERKDNLENITEPEHLAYVIYTSGSTGEPKGCMISHKAICNRLLWMQELYDIGSRDRILQKTPYTFDVSVWEFFLPLISGACMVVAEPKGHVDNRYVVGCVRENRVTVCHFVPSMLRFFLNQADVSRCTSLSYVFVSGETLKFDLVENFKRLLPAKLVNLYGPTEAAVDVTHWTCEVRKDGKVPIGRPIWNTQIYILDPEMKPVPIGEPGELYIGGGGLAKGYLNRPQLTAQRFVKSPFDPRGHSRLYRTGDEARFLADGDIEFLGRLDSQVKLRGLRIELGEVEAALNAHNAVEQSIVAVKDEKTFDPKLVAYVVVKQEVETRELVEFLKKKLPEYMVPNIIAAVESIPVTQHGKADRKALPWPVEQKSDGKSGSSLASGINIADPSKKRVEEVLTQCVADLLRRHELKASDDLFESGATSFTVIQLIEQIEKNFGVVFPVETFLDNPTVESISGRVHGLIKENASVDVGAQLATWAYDREPEAARVDKEIERRVIECISELLGGRMLSGEEDLFNVGATSFTMMQIIEKIERDFGVTLSVDTFLDDPRIGSIAGALERSLKKEEGGNRGDPAAASRAMSAINPEGDESHAVRRADRIVALPQVKSRDNAHPNFARRPFADQRASIAVLGRFLSLLKQRTFCGQPKYLYASAGGLNPIQTYLYVREDGVPGLARGVYYYHPVEHCLCQLSDGALISSSAFREYDRSCFESANFAIFFIAQLRAIEPIYKSASGRLSVLEVGYMAQLLVSKQEDFGLGVAPMTGVDFDEIGECFCLDDGHRFVHGLFVDAPYRTVADSAAREGSTEYTQHPAVDTDPRRCTTTWRKRALSMLTLEAERLVLPRPDEKKHVSKHRTYLREVSANAPRIELEELLIDDSCYPLRSTKREYLDQPVPFDKFGEFLALMREERAPDQEKRLYRSLDDGGGLAAYLYVKDNGVEGISGGTYLYDAKEHRLVFIRSGLSRDLKSCHTPFNRKQVEASKFCLFLTIPIGEAEKARKEESIYVGLLEAGHIGQLLLDRQAECDMGVCPIGGLRFEEIRKDFELSPKDELVHSFVCGGYRLDPKTGPS